MDKELAGPTRANYLLHMLAIKEACDLGCRYYHMGDSGTSKALAHFKTRFGAAPHPYCGISPRSAADHSARPGDAPRRASARSDSGHAAASAFASG